MSALPESQFFAYSVFSGVQFFSEGSDFNRYIVAQVAGRRRATTALVFGARTMRELNQALDGTSVTHIIESKRFE